MITEIGCGHIVFAVEITQGMHLWKVHFTGWFGSGYVVVYFLMEKGTVDLNKTCSVEQSAPLMVLVSSRCHFGLPALPLQNLKGANVYSGVAKRPSI